MKIAIFAAVTEEISKISHMAHFTGIGRENATRAILEFVDSHKGENFTIMNVGTVGAHSLPVGSIVRIGRIESGGAAFNGKPMLTDKFDIDDGVREAVLFSSDCFVSPHVYSAEFLGKLAEKADCFDMESSAVYAVAKHFGIPFVSYKIVSDNLDVGIDEWKRRVDGLQGTLCDFATDLIERLRKTSAVELI